jgi:hypothetical protein
MADHALVVARVLFWICAAGVVLLPMRWAFFCFILASHLDITTLTFTSATAVGFENTTRIAGLPLVLLLRTGVESFKSFLWTKPQKIWVALIVYTAIAGLWSTFPLSAAKMVVYLAAYFVLFGVFCAGWQGGWLDVAVIQLSAWCALVLAVVQTFFLENFFGGPEERFTSFSSPQYFAAFLVALLAILVFCSERTFFNYATCGALCLGIVVSGSRYVFVSAVALVVIACFQVASEDDGKLRWRPNLKKLMPTLAAAGMVVLLLASFSPTNRIDELIYATADDQAGVSGVEDVGTFAWRLSIYADIFEKLDRRTALELFSGSGTSSGASLMLNHDPDHYDREGIDANRVLHSEFLRALYEWGILGLVLLVGFVIATSVGFVKKIAAEGGGVALAFAGALPSIVMGLAIENILAGAASAGGVGILLAMTYAWSGRPVQQLAEAEEEEVNADGAALTA